MNTYPFIKYQLISISKFLIQYSFLFIFLLTFSNCSQNEKAAPKIGNIVFTNSLNVEIELTDLQSDEKVNIIATDQHGNIFEFLGLTGQPILISTLPEGNVYTFQVQLEYQNGKGKIKQSDFGPSTSPVLASKNLDTNFNRIEMLKKINDARSVDQICGGESFVAVSHVVWNDLLEDASEIHSLAMETQNFFGHENPATGQRTDDRLRIVQYPYRAWSENIAEGYPTVAAVFKAWIESPSHCRNMMNPDIKEVGVFKQGTYWTQVFGAR